MAKRSPEDDDDVIIRTSENRENGSYDPDEDIAPSDNDHNNDEDDDMNHQHQQNDKKKKKKKKKKRVRVMAGQTDNDRRVLRRRQRELHNDITMDVPAAEGGGARGGGGGNNDDEDSSDDEQQHINKSKKSSGGNGGGGGVLSWREKNNALWDDVRYTREAVLDSENLDIITSKAAREVEKIVQVPRYDAITLAQNLVKKGSTKSNGINQFNWQGLGFQVGVCFSSLPTNCSFLYGPLDAEYKPKERKKVERKKKSDMVDDEEDGLEEDEPEDMEQKKKMGDGNELSAVEKHIKVISTTLKARTKEEGDHAKERVGQYMTQLTQEENIDDERELMKREKKFMAEATKIDATQCLFNPKSFTQTVENIFHFSFAVKSGKAEIKTRGLKEAEEYGLEPGPVLMAKDKGDVEIPNPKQAIVALNMKDWRDMCAAYSVEESDVPHRVKGEPAKKKARKSKSD